MKKLLILSLLFASCTSKYMIKEDIPQINDQVESYILASGMSFPNSFERQIITKSLYFMFGYIEQKFGEQLFQKFYLTALHGTPLPEAVRNVFGQTFYRLISEAYLSLAPEKLSADTEMISTNFGIFRLHYFPGSPAEKDLHLIFYTLKNYFTSITNFLIESPQALANLKTNLSLVNNKVINIVLYEDREQGGIMSIAESYISYLVDSTNHRFVADIGMQTAYYNTFSSYVFSHELTHLVMGMSAMERPLAPIPYPETMQTKGNVMTDELKEYLMSIFSTNIGYYLHTMGNSWGEGIAEYETSKCNFFFKYGILDDVDNDLKYFMKNGGVLTPLPRLIDNGLWAGFDQTMTRVNYQEMHSAVAFIIKKYGWKKLKELLKTYGNNADFLRIFELSKEQIGDLWLASLKAE